MGAMDFSYRDLYPTMGGTETSTEVVPEADDMEALVESEQDAQKVGRQARGFNMAIVAVVLVAVVVLIGGAK